MNWVGLREKGWGAGFIGLVLAVSLAWLILPGGGAGRKGGRIQGRLSPYRTHPGKSSGSAVRGRERAEKRVARRLLGRIRLLERRTGTILKGMEILLEKKGGPSLDLVTAGDGTFPRPPDGVYTLSPKKWGFRPVLREIRSGTDVIRVEGVGRVKLVLDGEHPGRGSAALLPLKTLKTILSIRDVIPETDEFLARISTMPGLRKAWEEGGKEFFPGTKTLTWDGVPVGRKIILVVSHSRIYKVSPPCPRWAGVVFDLAEDGKNGRAFVLPEGDFKPPCPISRSLIIRAGKVASVKAFFRQWATLFIYCDAFRGASEMEMNLCMEQLNKNEGICGWPSVFEERGKPRELVEIPRLFPGNYVLQAACLFRKERRILFSYLPFTIEKGKNKKVLVSRGIGPYSFFVENPHGKWEKDSFLRVESSEPVAWPNFRGGGFFTIPETLSGDLEVSGLFWKRGRVQVECGRGEDLEATFDLGKGRRFSLK